MQFRPPRPASRLCTRACSFDRAQHAIPNHRTALLFAASLSTLGSHTCRWQQSRRQCRRCQPLLPPLLCFIVKSSKFPVGLSFCHRRGRCVRTQNAAQTIEVSQVPAFASRLSSRPSQSLLVLS